MSQIFTLSSSGDGGRPAFNIVLEVPDSPSTVTQESSSANTISAYAVTSAAGTFGGATVSLYSGGLNTNADVFAEPNSGLEYNNLIKLGPVGDLSSPTQNGVDDNGLMFSLSDGNLLRLSFDGSSWRVQTIGPTGTTTTLNYDPSAVNADAPCFLAGTRLLTERGEVAVEDLRIGDRLVTASGELRPAIWIGRKTVSALFADPLRSYPIRIRAGALADKVPSRDLLVSPDHALMVEDVLIQAGALINGTSITRETAVPAIFVYYHVELDDHSLIFAENAPAETFVDNIERMNFDNWAEHEALFPDSRPIVEMLHPRAKARRQVPAGVRAALDLRAVEIGAATDAAA